MPQKVKKESVKRSATVTLAGKSYTIHALAMKPAREWRQKHAKPIQGVIAVLRNAGKLEIQDDNGAWNIGGMAGLLQQVGSLLLRSVDVLVDALFDYAPALEADRAWIEDNADDVEAMAALWEVIQLAYPFGFLSQMVGGNGPLTNGTSSKLSAPNGATLT